MAIKSRRNDIRSAADHQAMNWESTAMTVQIQVAILAPWAQQ